MNCLGKIVVVLFLAHSSFVSSQPWFQTINDKKMFRFDYNTLKLLLQTAQKEALKKFGNVEHKFFIRDDENLHIDGFISKNSIDLIDHNFIKNSLFIVFFHTDDDYVYTLKKIKDYEGKYYSIPSYHPKVRYSWVDKQAMRSIDYVFSNFGSKISHQNLSVHEGICMCLNATKELPGDYVEIGVYKGGSALTALTYMKNASISRRSYFFDTFNGMTYQEALESSDVLWQSTHILWGVNETMKYIHDLLVTTQQNFKLLELNICQNDLPSEITQIAVCNVDVDLYEATRSALEKVAPLMVKGGIIICEDPTSTPGLGGALLAMDEFLMTTLGKSFVKILAGAHYLLIKIT